jgi:Phage tail tube protein
MTVQNTARSYLGIAKETTKGTPVAPTDFIPVASTKMKPVDVIGELLASDMAQGSLVKNYAYVQGRSNSTYDFGGPVYPDTIGYVLGGVLGSVTTTGSTAPYTHVISLKNATSTGADAQPTAFTLTDFYAANVRAYPGIQFSDFSMKFTADGMLDYDAKGTGWSSQTASTPTPSFSTVLPTPVWLGTVSIGGTTISNAVDGNIDMMRPVTPIFGLANTKDPYQVFLGALETKGKVKFVMENDTELTRYLTNTQPALTFNWSQGTGASATQISFTVTKGAYTAAMIDRSKDFVEIDVEINAIANTTDAGSSGGYSNIKWTLQNAKPSGTYQ